MNMTLSERHQHIISKLKEKEKVLVTELCEVLNVSPVTVRKDLKMLEEKNLLFRTHGGATATNPYIIERPVNEKESIRSTEKTAIGYTAALLVEANDCIIIASGTTVSYFARHIKPMGNLTVITAAIHVAVELNRHPNAEVLVLGGFLRKSSSSVTGFHAENILEEFSCSKLFLGVDGIDPDFGISTTHIQEAQLNRKMIAAAQKTIVLADSSKFGKRGFGRICGMEVVDQVITDKGISVHMLNRLKDAGVEVLIV